VRWPDKKLVDPWRDPSQSCHDIDATDADNRDSVGKGAPPAADRERTQRRGVNVLGVGVEGVGGAFETQRSSDDSSSDSTPRALSAPCNSTCQVLISAA
jgi:hypothetical protein